MCLHTNNVYKGQASLLVHTQADSYPHPTTTSSHRTNPTGSQADKLKIPVCARDYTWKTTTLLKQTQIHKPGYESLVKQVARFPITLNYTPGLLDDNNRGGDEICLSA